MDRITNDRFILLEEQVEELKQHVDSQDNKWVEIANKQNELITDLIGIVKQNEEKYISLLEHGFAEISTNVDQKLSALKLNDESAGNLIATAKSMSTSYDNAAGSEITLNTGRHNDEYTLNTNSGPNNLKVVTQTKRQEYQDVIVDNFVGKIVDTVDDDVWIAFKVDVTVPTSYYEESADVTVWYHGIDSDGFEIDKGYIDGKIRRGSNRVLTGKERFDKKDFTRIVEWKIDD